MRIRLVIAILSKTGKIGTSRFFAFYTAGTDECTEVRNRREILTCHAGCCPGVTRLPPFLQVLRRLPGDRSWYVPLHPVGGQPAEQRPQERRAASLICASRYTSTALRAWPSLSSHAYDLQDHFTQ